MDFGHEIFVRAFHSDLANSKGFCVSADYPTIVLEGFLNMSGVIHQIWFEEHRASGREPEADAYSEKIVKRYQSLGAMLDDGWTVD